MTCEYSLRETSHFHFFYVPVCTMNLSAPMHTITRVCYDSLDDLIHNIQLYTSTQVYAVSCPSCVNCMSLHVYVPPCISPLRAHVSFLCMSLHVYVLQCIFLRVYVPSVRMSPSCACLPCVCPSVSMFPSCACSLSRCVYMSLHIYVTPCVSLFMGIFHHVYVPPCP